MASRNQQKMNSLTGTMVEGIGQRAAAAINPLSPELDASLRVEYVQIKMIHPDPAQPRRVLPKSIHDAFHQNHFSAEHALEEFINLVTVIARRHGRIINKQLEPLYLQANSSELELTDQELASTESPTIKLTPEEELLKELVNLAVTFRDEGQINPITVVEKNRGVYLIETGERRFWAKWLLIRFLANYSGDDSIPVLIIAPHEASAFRQAKENTSRSGLNAIAMARQAARLMLYVHGIQPPNGLVSNDYYREALSLDLKSKREFTDAILSAMGGISRVHFSRFKALLRLSDEAIELADRHNLDESLLRLLLDFSDEDQVRMINDIVKKGLSRRQLEAILQEPVDDSTGNELSKQIRRNLKVLRSTSSIAPFEIARELYEEQGDFSAAREFIRDIRKFLDQVEEFLIEE